MLLPWFPVILLDILGPLAVLLTAVYCIGFARQWIRKNPDAVFPNYIFLLTFVIGVFAISRSVGHLAKEFFTLVRMPYVWKEISPYSGAVNSVAFMFIAAFSVFFHKFRSMHIKLRDYKNHLEDRVRETTATLREELHFQKELTDSLPVPIFFKDRTGVYMGANTACVEFLGITEEDLIGRNDHEIMPADLAARLRALDRKALTQNKRQSIEDAVPGPDGRLRQVVIYEGGFSDPDGGMAGLIGTIFDITDRKRLEGQLVQAQKMESIGRLAGGVAHDFNNVLSAIIGYSDLSLSSLAPDDPLARNIGHIQDAGHRAAALVRQLLAFSHKQVLEMKVINLNVVIENITRMLERLIGEDVEIVLKTEENLANIKADTGQMEQILMNLAVNARDAMPTGGSFTIETANIDITEDYCETHAGIKPGAYVMLTASDSGVGMSKEIQEKIFEPFFTTKQIGKGTGLGLATTYGIIKQHKGFVFVYSEVGKGSAFKIFLPAVRREAAQVKNGRSLKRMETKARGTGTILVVDDESSIRELAVDSLHPLGYHLIAASNGVEALEANAAYKSRIDLLLTDLVMPGMNGRELANRLRDTRPEMRVVFMSGYSENVISHEGQLDEGVNFIQKPLTPDKLITMVQAVLAGD